MSYPPAGGYGYPPNPGYPPPPQQQAPAPTIGFDGLAQPGGGGSMPLPGGGYNAGYGQATPYPSGGGMPMPGAGAPYGQPGAPYGQPGPPSMQGVALAASAAVNFSHGGYSQQQTSGFYPAASHPPYAGGAPPQQSYGGAPAQPPYAGGAPTQQSYGGAPAQPPYAGGASTKPSYSTPTASHSPSPSSSNIPKEPETQGTVKDFQGFNAQKDAEVLRKAMKGFGTDEKAVTHIISTRSNRQRQQIKLEFATLYGKDLLKELRSELSGNYETAILALMCPADEYDAYQLYSAMKGLGTDEAALIEVLCTRTNKQIQAASHAYKRLYRKDLEKEIHGETSGHFRRLLVSLVQGSRLENQPLDHRKAAEDAQALYQAGEARWGTDESRFNVILATRSFPQLRLTFEEYRKISKRTLQQAISSEMSGDLKDGMKAVVKCASDRAAFFAERLHWSMKGLGTDDKTLIRIMVSRSEIDMVQIKAQFQKMYGKTLASFISDDCSGDYKKLLLQLAGGN
ncbi:annexin-B12-like [Hydractinia symbiolongicarpus]|uniref:annexin-B12-like n=1 Tax=Hydractinia symbiolongicarpus TaxID=13093 RepID=UPI00254EB7E6|nr:annexin-B12-like [Hydractinia symbiolongicarpus]